MPSPTTDPREPVSVSVGLFGEPDGAPEGQRAPAHEKQEEAGVECHAASAPYRANMISSRQSSSALQ